MPLRVVTLIVGVVVLITSAAARDVFDWVPYVNERFGFSLRYPANVFEPERRSEAGDGEVFAGIRGRGRLLVGALENSDGHTLGSYMNMVRQQSYTGYNVDYAPRGATWFVLSGENDRDVFYEKVIFSCSGRVINSFALIYPIESKREFDPIVEGIEKTFRPGQDCGRYATR
jgi:opacity protein-like surface antigen